MSVATCIMSEPKRDNTRGTAQAAGKQAEQHTSSTGGVGYSKQASAHLEHGRRWQQQAEQHAAPLDECRDVLLQERLVRRPVDGV